MNYNDNYVEIQKEIEELEKNRKELHTERINLVMPLYELKSKYPDVLAIIPGNFNGVDPHGFSDYLGVAKQEVERSSLEYEKQKEIINVINNIKVEMENINKKQDEIDERLIKELGPRKAKRREYLEEKYKEQEEILEKIRDIKNLVEKRKLRKEQLEKSGAEPEIINSFETVISNYNNEIAKLNERLDNIYSEKGLQEELDLLKKEKSKEEQDRIEQLEKEAKENLDKEKEKHREAIKRKLGEESESSKKEEDKKQEEPKEEDKKKEKTDEKKDKEEKVDAALKPEKRKKVKGKHKASKKIIDKIKNTAGYKIGLTTILLAIALAIANPKLIINSIATGKTLEQVLGYGKK